MRRLFPSPRFRRLFTWPLFLALSASLGGQWMAAPAARGQTPSTISLTLVSQSVWNGPNRPLGIVVHAANGTDSPLSSLSFVLTIGAPTRSRSVYEQSLNEDATTPIVATPFAEPGTLQPGESETFHLVQPLDSLAVRDESALYPVKVELLSNDVPVATIRTPMVFLIEPPKVPLNLTWTWVLAESVQFGPDGVFRPGSLEADVAPGGRIDAMVSALSARAARPVDVVISPVLIDDLSRMAQGYRIRDALGAVRTVPKGQAGAADAARILSELKDVAVRTTTELLAEPFPDPNIPALIRGGFGDQIPRLISLGRAMVTSAVGGTPSAEVVRPPRSQLDAATLSGIVRRGGRIALVDAGAIPTEAGLPSSPSPVVRVSAAGQAIDAVRPDAGVEAASTDPRYRTDPRLAAQAALGELAAIWFELPGTPGRGAAVLFPDNPPYPARFFPGFATLVRASPWLRTVTASSMDVLVTNPERRPLPFHRYPGYSAGYLVRLGEAQQALRRFGAIVLGARALTSRLDQDLVLAEAGTFLPQPELGDRFIDAVQGAIHRVYAKILVPPHQKFTLASRTGTLPVTIENRAGYRVRVVIRLVADRSLDFVSGNVRRVTLQPGNQVFAFAVRAETTGRFPIKVQLQTSSTAPEPDIVESQILVRSTAYNRVALFLTIGAALFLLLWWGRRFLPRRTS